jgi:hypothetical protein
MEKGWWASSGEGDPCSSWPCSLSSFKSSLMLSVLLSVKEIELLVMPYCHVFEKLSSLLFAFVAQLSFNFFLLSSRHGSNLSSHRHHWLPCRPCCCLIFHSFSFTSRRKHVLKHPYKLKFIKLSFQRAIIHIKRVSNKRVVPILLWQCDLSKAAFRLRGSMFEPYLLVRVFKIDDSWCIRNMVWRSFWILTFLPLYISEHVLKSWWKQLLPSQAL